jgi:hypothetical protein
MSGARRLPSGRRDSAPIAASALPELALPSPQLGQKCGFSLELRQISFADLLSAPPTVAEDEVVARSRHQLSLPHRTPPASDDLEVELLLSPAESPPPSAAPDLPSEPTRDLRTQARPAALPLESEPTQVPPVPSRSQPGKFKLWGWWKR